jgi:hypothetical protein
MPANWVMMEGSDGGALATPGGGRWELRRRCAAAVRFENSEQKARSGFLRCGLCSFCDDGVIAGDLPDMSNRFRVMNKLRKIRRNDFDKLKPLWPTVS